MRKTALILVAASMISAFAGIAAAAGKTVYVDTQAVFEKSSLGKKYQEIIREYYESRKKVLDADAAEIQKMQEGYRKQKDAKLLNEKAQKQKEETINRRIADFQKKQDEFGAEIGKKQSELIGDFNQKMVLVLKAIAKKEKASLVLTKGLTIARGAEAPVVLFADEELDLTERLVAEMDKSQSGK